MMIFCIIKHFLATSLSNKNFKIQVLSIPFTISKLGFAQKLGLKKVS